MHCVTPEPQTDTSIYQNLQVTFQPRIQDLNQVKLPLADIVAKIRGQEYKSATDSIRTLALEQDLSFSKRRAEEISDLKRTQLACFTPTILFNDETTHHSQNYLSLTGIIQFDLDRKDFIKNNIPFDVEYYRQKIQSISSCFYCFQSPSGGLKVGIITDLDINNLSKNLFKLIYARTQEEITALLPDCLFDSKAAQLALRCYISSDPECYFNADAKPLSVLSIKEPTLAKQTYKSSDSEMDDKQVDHYLQQIPQNLGHDDRLRVFATCHNIGIDLSTTLSIWNNNPDTLRQINNWYASHHVSEPNAIGLLAHITKVVCGASYQPYSRQTIGGWQTHNLRKRNSKLVSDTLPELFSLAECHEQIKEVFNDRELGHISIQTPTGSGKTYQIIKELASKYRDIKFLYLAPTIALAEQSCELYNRMARMEEEKMSFSRGRFAKDKQFGIVIYGRGKLCTEKDDDNRWQGIVPPAGYCRHSCPKRATCAYIKQFDVKFGQQRFGTHNTLYNETPLLDRVAVNVPTFFQQKYSNIVESYKPKQQYYAKHIIVDESPLQYEHVELNTTNPLYDIINNDTLREHKDFIDDSYHIYQRTMPVFEDSITDYVKKVLEFKENRVLEICYDFCDRAPAMDDTVQHDIHGLNLDGDEINMIKKAKAHSARYVLLDATANIGIQSQIFNEEFKDCCFNIKRENDNEVIIDRRYNVSKTALKDKKKMSAIVNELKSIIKSSGVAHKDIGLITHQMFEADLAEKLGILYMDNTAHFGAVAGLNIFNQKKLLIVLGQFLLPENITVRNCNAIYPIEFDWYTNRIEKEQLLRMSDGTVRECASQGYENQYLNDVSWQSNTAETIQAWGRFRQFSDTGQKRQLYCMTNLLPEDDLQITEIIEPFEPTYSSFDFLVPTLTNLMKMGFTRTQYNDGTYKEYFADQDIKLQELVFKTKSRKKSKMSVYICNNEAFENWYTSKSLTLIDK